MFTPEKAAALRSAKLNFRVAMLQNDTFLNIFERGLREWQSAPDPSIQLGLQPSLLPQGGSRANQFIVAGVQVSLKDGQEQGPYGVWHYVDLFTYMPSTEHYTSLPDMDGAAGANFDARYGLYNCWRSAVHALVQPFAPGDLAVSGCSGEIDFLEMIDEDPQPLLLPA